MALPGRSEARGVLTQARHVLGFRIRNGSKYRLNGLSFGALSGLFLMGCYSTEKVCDEAVSVEPTVQLGAWNNNTFYAFEEGEVVAPAWGPQGGQHIWAAVLATGINPGNGEMVSDNGGFLDFLFPQPSRAGPVHRVDGASDRG